jgi:hypothetical protein
MRLAFVAGPLVLVLVVGCGAGASVVPRRSGCDPLTPSYCGFPYPNDYWTVLDSETATGIRLALPQDIMPATVRGLRGRRIGVRSQPDAFNEMDGFSPGIAAMTHFPDATAAGLAAPDSIEASLDPSSPTVIIEAETGRRVPHWVDLDEWVIQVKVRGDEGKKRPGFTVDRNLRELGKERALMLRPAIRLEDATRYIVAIRNVRDDKGRVLAPSQGFRDLRDNIPAVDPGIRSRRTHFEEIFEILEAAGVPREELQVAWDFTTASRQNNTSAMMHIRDDALRKYPNGVSYTVEVQEQPLEGLACLLEITFDMPLYLTKGATGGLLNVGKDGLPVQNGTYGYKASMIIPLGARSGPAALVAYGHGQLGTREAVLGFRPIAVEGNLAAFGLDHKGFSEDDIPTLLRATLGGDLSEFRAIPERMHQGMLNFLIAMRTLSRQAEGGPSTVLNQVLANDCGGAVIDGSKRYYFGGSQGGILGATIMALTTDIERGVLAVPGQPYNLLLNRSVNFDEYAERFYRKYGWNGLHMQMNLALMQGLWDRAEPTGYSKYIRNGRLRGTPKHDVVIQVSKGDHQVSDLGAHIMARTIGGVANLAPLIRPAWGVETKHGEHRGSAMIEVDFGNPEPPIINIPPWDDPMPDPHGRAIELPALIPALVSFYETGRIENPCDGPCDEDDIKPAGAQPQ